MSSIGAERWAGLAVIQSEQLASRIGAADRRAGVLPGRQARRRQQPASSRARQRQDQRYLGSGGVVNHRQPVLGVARRVGEAARQLGFLRSRPPRGWWRSSDGSVVGSRRDAAPRCRACRCCRTSSCRCCRGSCPTRSRCRSGRACRSGVRPMTFVVGAVAVRRARSLSGRSRPAGCRRGGAADERVGHREEHRAAAPVVPEVVVADRVVVAAGDPHAGARPGTATPARRPSPSS